ncbi:winged helix-turn-helix transcriptional regulator [Paenibacillus albidus]|uniref:MarR family winged helix-turn-helix transcriptional regulator n=1 Tax=Paenibacillus albidus TaxID=2041023 RepID=UPI001BE9D082|nr:MarR family winged helix-turn-helix transcriptional regulator [Paenibacillus albidus]MBT2293338.1 winged helix-turn-helix transcriptional regulator [Paenibacillus albidus]
MNLQELNLIDLLSEKHLFLRQKVTELSPGQINKTESHIMAVLEAHKMLSISEISRIINISRQGTHKSIQGLLSRGYIEGVDVANNQRDKHLVLTPKGIESNRKMLIVKRQLEQQIADKLGPERIELVKALLKEDWLES